MTKSKVPRDESVPRQSNLFAFLSEEEFDSIPQDTLENKAAEGIEKHALLENTYDKVSQNLLVMMFKEGLTQIFTYDELSDSSPIFEEQLNGKRFTGAPDFLLHNTLIDYKFCLDLRPKTALQLVAYGMLEKEIKGIDINRFFAFHFPDDRSLYIHRVNPRVVPVLIEFTNFVIENHNDIGAGELVKFEALSRWEEIQRDYDIFESVCDIFPPMMIESREDEISAVMTFIKIKEIQDREKILKREIRRYMDEQGITELTGLDGYSVRISNCAAIKIYDKEKKAVADSIHKAALEDALQEKIPNTCLKRFKPKKKEKLIK